MKKTKRANLNKQMLQLWSKDVRNRDLNRCIICFSDKYLDAHHLLPKERYPLLKLELSNGITLCKKHHKFGKFSFHKNPWWSVEWLRVYRPEQYHWAMVHLEYSHHKEGK